MPEVYNDVMGNFSSVLPQTIAHVEPFTDFSSVSGAPAASESLMDGQAVPKSVENTGRTPSRTLRTLVGSPEGAVQSSPKYHE